MSKVVPDLRTEVQPHLRWMIKRDLPEVVNIERDSYPSPWLEADFLHELARRDCIGLVAELGDYIIGYAVYEFRKHRYVLTNVAVHPDYRRRGVATALINRLKAKMSTTQKPKISVDLRESNLAAQLLFKSAGFSAIKIIRGYYEDTDEDAYYMEFNLCPPKMRTSRKSR